MQNFHNEEVMAPLKPAQENQDNKNPTDFHNEEVMAPLKLAFYRLSLPFFEKFP